MSSVHFAPVLLMGLFAWSIYRRVRRNIGRQKLHPRRAITSIIIISVVSTLIVGTSRQNAHLLLGYIAGLLPGALLGFAGLRLTRFETADTGHFYTPNTPIGVALSLLLVGRIAYRFMVLRDVAAAPNHPPPMQSPLTFLILGLVAGYYIVYQTGLLLHCRDKNVSGQKSFAWGGSNLDSSRDRP